VKTHLAHRYEPGSLALIKGSFEEVEVIAAMGDYVLVKRGAGQWTYTVDQLEPYDPEFCPIEIM
jgi:hypothetical protein